VALNLTCDGFTKLDDGVTLADANVKYQAYFYKVNSGSSSSTWNDVRTVEGGASKGYYSFNLGDGDFLTQTGSASTGDVIIVVFWKPTTADRLDSCGPLTEWGSFRIVLGTGPGMVSSDVYTNQVQIKYNICPNLSWDLPLTANVGQNVTATNSSTDTHQWSFGSVTMWQRNSYYTTLQTVNAVDNTDYDWGDLTQDLDLSGAANGTHSWSASGDYTVEIVIEDECGCTVTGTKPIRILNNAPTCGITCHQATGQNITTPDTVVTFAFDGTDTDNKITSIDWKINDSGSYGNTDTSITGVPKGNTVSHSNGLGTDWYGHAATAGAFTNPGAHLIELWAHWNDGFSNHTLYCSETFTQQRFTGPTVSFTQDPAQATVGSGIEFENTSTSTSRVGTGLPSGDEYDWTWKDGPLVETELDKPYSYKLQKTPTTASGNVELCANWQDGWDNKVTCTDEDVVFATTVTITEVECYYNLNIVGTSSDGSVSGYSWDVYKYTTYSGVGPPSGPTELLWESPAGIEQQDKKVCFTSAGWYVIEGFVHGTGADTSDTADLYVTEVCAETVVSGVAECTLVIWNGTGPDDLGGDWNHGGKGVEADYAKHTGTNGLDVTGLKKNQHVQFTSGTDVDIGQYDLLSVWVNVQSWNADSHLEVGFDEGGTVNLNAYIDRTITNVWQRALIPYEDLGLTTQTVINVHQLDFTATGDMSFYLDDVEVAVGTVSYLAIPICDPDLDADEFGVKATRGKEIRPGIKAEEPDLKPVIKGRAPIGPPDMKSGVVIGPPDMKPFPPPRNL